MRVFYLLTVFSCLVVILVSSSPSSSEKVKRTILPFLRRIFGYGYSDHRSKCGTRQCPKWKCQDDSAVIHGYCCHCPGWQNDNVPVPCQPNLKCPIDHEPLCSDYNFMMECCCTGP